MIKQETPKEKLYTVEITKMKTKEHYILRK